MADISKLTLPNGNEVNLKDSVARGYSGPYFATCDTLGNLKDKEATVQGSVPFVLRVGTVVGVKFSRTDSTLSTASEPVTLNVNETGAFSIYYNASTVVASYTQCPIAFGSANTIVYYMYDGTYWVWLSTSSDANTDTNTIPAAICETSPTFASKIANYTGFSSPLNGAYIYITMRYGNTVRSAITLNINETGYKPVYINGNATSYSNYNIPPGPYIIQYTNGYYNFRTDGRLPGSIAGAAISASTLSSTLAVNKGGTGATTVEGARTNLGLGSAATYDAASTVENDDSIPTGAAIRSYVSGLGGGTVTKVTAGTGLTGGDITTTGTIALDTSGVTAGSAGPTQNVTGTDGSTISVPKITVDSYGRVTDLSTYTLTNKDTDTTYSLSMSGNVITLTGSSGSPSSITLPVYNGGVT